MKILITGAAGFIGSRTTHRLLDLGHECVGIDSLTPYYDPAIKRARLAELVVRPGFTHEMADLRFAPLVDLVDGMDVVVHLAAQPGVRASWSDFAGYNDHNVLATHRLLAAATDRVDRFVYASSSSVYGESLAHLTTEDQTLRPRSPYGATKLGGEHLCDIYSANHDLHTVMLRYFTVFGPGQRPDMAMHRIIESALGGGTFPRFGSGRQVRDFTFVEDVVTANVLAATQPSEPGERFNVAGGTSASLNEVIETIESITGRTVPIEELPSAKGDVKRTSGSTAKISETFGWKPTTDLRAGLEAQVEWHHQNRTTLLAAS